MENQQERQAVALPKNIRQIGSFGDTYKIYVEDFVYTYVHQFLHEKKTADAAAAAVLLGEVRQEGNVRYVFISGAQECDADVLMAEEKAQAAEEQEFWGSVYQKIKQHFSGRDILGWYVGRDGSGLELTPQLSQFFERTYSRGSRFLYYADPLERLDAFYVQEQHALQRVSGYAVYYEKNPQMQEFMVSERERRQPQPAARPVSDAKEEDVAANYRAIMNRLNERPGRKKIQPVLYTAGVAVLAVVAATGIAQIGNYRNLRGLENTLQTLSGAVTGTKKDAADAQEEKPAEAAGTQEEKETAAPPAGTGETPQQAPETLKAPENTDPAAGTGQEQTAETSGTAQPAPGETGSGQTESEKTGSGQTESGETDSDQTEPGKQDQAAAGSGEDTLRAETADPAKEDADADKDAVLSKEAGAGVSRIPEYYVVKKGDSLVSISRKFYKSIKMVDKICALNKIKDMDLIYEGQKLRLP